MREADFGFAALLCYTKDKFCVLSFVLIFCKVEVIVGDQPNDSVVGDELHKLHRALVYISIAVLDGREDAQSPSQDSGSDGN